MTYFAALLAVVLVLLAPGRSLAQDYLTDAVQALASAPIYVAPGTEGTDKDTAGKLQGRLTGNDKIVLVMLPAQAETSLGDPLTIATQLSERLGNQRIIGLSVGRKVVGYAPFLPPGVAADQMRRANSVSNDSVTALSTFTQNIHQWQLVNPEPTPTVVEVVPVPISGDKEPSAILPGVGVGALIGAGLFLLWKRRRKVRTLEKIKNLTRANITPNPIALLLEEIEWFGSRVRDPELSGTIGVLCQDIKRYFLVSSQNKEWDTTFFKDRLTEVVSVLDKYIDIQNNPRYYHNPEFELQRGKESITDFGHYVLESIRRGNAAALLEYSVNTKILQAQRDE